MDNKLGDKSLQKIKYVRLVFENCQIATLEPHMFRYLHIDGIQQNRRINNAQYECGECFTNLTCTHFYIEINQKGLWGAKLEPSFGESLSDRLESKDISHIELIYHDKNECIQVPYDDENCVNKFQRHSSIDCEHLRIEIKEKQYTQKDIKPARSVPSEIPEKFNINVGCYRKYVKNEDLCLECKFASMCSYKKAADDPKYAAIGFKAYVNICSDRKV